MKKLLFLLVTILICNEYSAQITITDVDMPSVNDTFRISETFDIQGIDPALTGVNYSWNYSTLIASTQRIDTFVSVTSTPLAYQFYFNNNIVYPNHKASYALRGRDINIPQASITEVFNYIKKSSAAYDNVGFGSKIAGVPSSTQNDPVDREYVFPMNYNDTHVSNSEYGITIPGFGYYGESMERIDTVDGWGTLTTPYGTFSCLRVKSVLHKIDTTYIDAIGFGSLVPRPEEIEYKWLAAGKGIPVLKIVTTSGVVSQIEYQDSARVVSVDELSMAQDFNVYPNPVKSVVNIEFTSQNEENIVLYLKDISGKKILSVNKKSVVGRNLIQLNTKKQAIPSGIYILDVNTGNRVIKSKKLIIID